VDPLMQATKKTGELPSPRAGERKLDRSTALLA